MSAYRENPIIWLFPYTNDTNSGDYYDTNQTLIRYLRFSWFCLGYNESLEPQHIHLFTLPFLCHAWHVLHLPCVSKGLYLLSGDSCFAFIYGICLCSQVFPIPVFLLQVFLHIKPITTSPQNPLEVFSL